MEKILMEILSKNILIQQALKTQNAWLIKFELKKMLILHRLDIIN